jgi:hypothetical protein
MVVEERTRAQELCDSSGGERDVVFATVKGIDGGRR